MSQQRLYPRVRPARAAAVMVAAAAFALAGCSTPARPAPRPTVSSTHLDPEDRYRQLSMAMVICFYQHHWIPARDMTGPYNQLPVHDGHIYSSTYIDQEEITQWYSYQADFVQHDGLTMDQLLSDADQEPSLWPANLCGPIPQPSPLIPSPRR